MIRPPPGPPATPGRPRALPGPLCRLERLPRVPRRILDEDLPSPGPGHDLVSEREAGSLHRLDLGIQVLDNEHQAIPPSRLRLTTVRHGPCSGALRSAQPQREIAVRDDPEGGTHSALQSEAELLGVETDGRI